MAYQANRPPNPIGKNGNKNEEEKEHPLSEDLTFGTR